MRIFIAFFFCLVALPVFAAELYPVKDAYLRETPMKISAGYLTISNPTKENDALVSISADWANKIELHEIAQDDKGVLKMKQVTSLPLEAGKDLVLKPGSYHIMIFGLKKPLAKNTQQKMTLHFDHAAPQDVMFDVKEITFSPDKKSSADHGHAHH